MKISIKENRKILILLFLIASLIRLAYLYSRSDKFILNCLDQYDEMAQSFLAGKGLCAIAPFGIGGSQPFYAFRSPVYPIFFLLNHLIFGDNFLAIKVILCLLNALTIFFIYGIAKEIFGKKIAISTAAIFAIFPTFIYRCAWLHPGILTTFLLALTIFLLLKGNRSGSYLLNIGSGIALGLTILCRGEYAAFLPFVFIWQVFFISSPWRWKKILTIFSFVALTMLPWTVRNYCITGNFIPLSSNGGLILWAANSSYVKDDRIRGFCMPGEFPEIIKKTENMSEVEADSYFFQQTLSYIKERPFLYWQRALRRFGGFWAPFLHRKYYSYPYWLGSGLIYLPLFFLAFIGALLAKEKQKDCSLFYLLFLSMTIVNMAIRTCIRYRLPIEPYLIILATFGLFTIKEKLLKNGKKNFSYGRGRVYR